MNNKETQLNKKRTIGIGDIHGCYQELIHLIEFINPTRADTIVSLGDYIDRGSDSKAVLDTLIDLKSKCDLVALLGNHESMMRESFNTNHAYKDRLGAVKFWLKNGGSETLDSYMYSSDDLLSPYFDESYIPDNIQAHLDFINSMPLYYETQSHIFVHATPFPDLNMDEQDEIDLVWRRAGRIDAQYAYNHISGKTIVSGHTAQSSGLPLALSEKNIIIDSGCKWTGWLTALDINDDKYIQASKDDIRLIMR